MNTIRKIIRLGGTRVVGVVLMAGSVFFPEVCKAQQSQISKGEIRQVLPSGFPEVPGADADSARWDQYRRAKELWIQQNPEAYRKMNQLPELYTREEQDSIRARKEDEMRAKETLPVRK